MPLKASDHVNCEKLFDKLYNRGVPKSLVRICPFGMQAKCLLVLMYPLVMLYCTYISCTLVNSIILSLTDPALSTVTFYSKLWNYWRFSLHVNL